MTASCKLLKDHLYASCMLVVSVLNHANCYNFQESFKQGVRGSATAPGSAGKRKEASGSARERQEVPGSAMRALGTARKREEATGSARAQQEAT